MAAAREFVEQLLRAADIQIDGSRPWDIRVHNEAFFPRALAGGTLGVGESYIDGWWDCEALDQMSVRAVAARLEERFCYSPRNLLAFAVSLLSNRQSLRRARAVGDVHYDLGNDFFEAMLDPWM